MVEPAAHLLIFVRLYVLFFLTHSATLSVSLSLALSSWLKYASKQQHFTSSNQVSRCKCAKINSTRNDYWRFHKFTIIWNKNMQRTCNYIEAQYIRHVMCAQNTHQCCPSVHPSETEPNWRCCFCFTQFCFLSLHNNDTRFRYSLKSMHKMFKAQNGIVSCEPWSL